MTNPIEERWRCLKVGCNPPLNAATAQAHNTETGHRVARWPVRSAEGQRRARERNRTGYYDKYNVGAKSSEARGFYNAGGGRVGIVSDDLFDDDGSWEAHQANTRG